MDAISRNVQGVALPLLLIVRCRDAGVHAGASQRSGRRAPPATFWSCPTLARSQGLLATFRASRSPCYQRKCPRLGQSAHARNVQGVALPLLPRVAADNYMSNSTRNVQGVALPLLHRSKEQ